MKIFLGSQIWYSRWQPIILSIRLKEYDTINFFRLCFFLLVSAEQIRLGMWPIKILFVAIILMVILPQTWHTVLSLNNYYIFLLHICHTWPQMFVFMCKSEFNTRIWPGFPFWTLRSILNQPCVILPSLSDCPIFAISLYFLITP